MKGDKREEEEDEPNPLASYGPGRIIKPVGKQRFRGWEVVAEAKIEVVEKLVMWPQDGEVLIRVRSFGVSGMDVAQRRGGLVSPVGGSPVLGQEVAGEVVALGEGSDALWQIGDRLCCMVPSGGFAEYCLCHASMCLPIPKGFSWQQVAALPLGCAASWFTLFDQGKLKKGEVVLIHGAAGGVGHLMVQIATAYGITVIASVRSSEEAQFCIGLGAKMAVDVMSERVAHKVMDFTRGKGVDLVIDIGSVPPSENTACLALEGRLVIMAATDQKVNIAEVFEKRLTVTGSSLRTREIAYKKLLAKRLRDEIWPLLEAGKVKPHVHAVVKFTEVHKALNAIEGLPSQGEGWQIWEKPVMGKIVCLVERTHGPPQALRSDT